MQSIDMTINRREIPVQPHNRIKSIAKQANGDLAVVFASGATGIIPASEPDIQAYAVYSVLAEL